MESNEGNFIAEIKEDNIASIKMAEKNGFVQHSKQVYKLKNERLRNNRRGRKSKNPK